MDWLTREMVMLYGVFGTLVIGLVNFFVNMSINKRTVFVNAVTSERVKWMSELKELLAEYISVTSYYEDKPFYEEREKNEYFERLIYLQGKIKLHLNHIDKRDEEINGLISEINQKIFGIYEAKKAIESFKKERLNVFSVEKQKGYFDKVFTEKVDKETAKAVFLKNDRDALVKVYYEVLKLANEEIKNKYGYKGRDELISKVDELINKSRIYLKEEWEKVKDEAQRGKLKKGKVTKLKDRYLKWKNR